MTNKRLSRTEASAAVQDSDWRYLLGTFRTSVPVVSLAQGAQVTAAVTLACGADADAHLTVDVRADRVELALQSVEVDGLTDLDVDLAQNITAAVRELGLATGGVTTTQQRSVQMIEVAIDALDRERVLPFWRAVLGYEDEPANPESPIAIVDPARQGPAFWFQQMDEPRPQRNRIHLDLTVSHEEAEARIAAALAAGGTLVSADAARAFWILADPEGNEVCVCTWQDRE